MPELYDEQYDLLIEAVRKCFWYKKPFVSFLTRCGVPKSRASQVHDAPNKVEFFREFIDENSRTADGRNQLYVIAIAISKLKHFTALDHDGQIPEARKALERLRDSFDELSDELPVNIRTQAQAIGKIPIAKHGKLRGELGERPGAMLVASSSPACLLPPHQPIHQYTHRPTPPVSHP